MTLFDNFINLKDYNLPDNYYVLNLYLTSLVPKNIVKKYKSLADTHNSIFDHSSPNYNKLFDAGIDLYTKEDMTISKETFSNKIDLGINCSMTFVSKNTLTNNITKIPCGYYLYPRSSTGSKTSLRLSNSIGVMDSGYRGNIIACFDNLAKNNYDINAGDRLVQICSPNITYPTLVNIVNNSHDLEIDNYINNRGNYGFGSSGR